MYIMGQESIPDKTAQEIRLLFAERTMERDLADAFALASNQFWWVEDNVYDFEEGTSEHQEACRITDEWGELMDEYKERIFELLIHRESQFPKQNKSKC